MSTENNKKQFCCEKCNFKCDKKYNWERHIMTSKHNINSNCYGTIKTNFRIVKKQ